MNPEKGPQENFIVLGLRVAMEKGGIALEQAVEEARKDHEKSKGTNPDGYSEYTRALEQAYQYLKSQQNK